MGQSCVYLEPHPAIKRAIQDSIDRKDYQGYAPPMGFPELHRLVLDDLGIKTPASCCVTDGGIEAIYHVAGSLPYDAFVDCDPGWVWPRVYATKPVLATKGKLTPNDVTPMSMVNFVNGQNPTGYEYTPSETMAIVDACRAKDAWLLVDATYHSYISDFVCPYDEYPEKTIVIWSTSKDMGLSGFRVGGFVSNQENMEKLASRRPNNLGSSIVGQRAAIAGYLSKADWLPVLLQTCNENKERIRSRVSAYGAAEVPSSLNHIWLTFSNYSASAIVAALQEKGILVRDCKYYPGFDQNTKQSIRRSIGIEDLLTANSIKVTVSVPPKWVEEFNTTLTGILDVMPIS